MAYSSSYWTSTDPSYGVADAQWDKLDLARRKLGLEPGTTLLDVGCGWGSLSLNAWTVAAWLETFEANVDTLTELFGEENVRVWRLYLVGGMLAFRDNRMGVDQMLCVRPGSAHPLPAVRSS